MRIAIDISQIVYGTGVSDYTYELVDHLFKIDSENKYSLLGFSLRQQSKIKSLFPSSKTFPIPPTALNILWNQLHLLPIETFSGKVDVYHSSDWAQAPSRSKKVTTIHDLSPFLYPHEMASGGARDIVKTHQAKMKWISRECDKIICVSNSTKNDLVKIFPSIEESRVVVIPEALPERFKIKPQPKKGDYVVTIGTQQPRKNIVRLIDSFLAFRKILNLPEKLIVIGPKGWGDSPVPKDKNVTFAGYLPEDELVAWVRGAQAFAFPSLYEGFGIPILIAFYHQIPVVTSNISSMPEIASNAAVLVDPRSEESIANGIASAIKNRKKLISSGSKQLEKYSWTTTAQKTLEVYKSLFD